MLKLENITISFGDRTVLDRINLNLETGRTTALIGPSGCGKSTLLRIIIGLLVPDQGRIEFDDTELSPENITKYRYRMGYVIQDGGLFPHLTAVANVSIAAESNKLEKQSIRKRIEKLRRLVQLPPDSLERYPAELSGGQQQRVGLMRALMLDPDLLLLDEPLAALDPLIRADMQSELRDIFRSLGKTVLMVTHDMGEAVFLCDRIVLMREGRIIQNGEPEDLMQRPADPFVTHFIQSQRNPLERRSTV